MPAKPPFIDDYLAYLLARASRLVSSEFHATLGERGIAIMHWRVMAALYDAPMTMSSLADIALLQLPTISKLVQRMEREDLVNRSVDAADRRRVLVALTKRGRRVAAPLVRLARHHERSVLEPFGARDSRMLIDVLKRLIASHAASQPLMFAAGVPRVRR